MHNKKQMHPLLPLAILFALILSTLATPVSVPLANHVAAKDIAFITFNPGQITPVPGLDVAAEVICQAVHNRRSSEQTIAELHWQCVSSLEHVGLQVNATRVDCAVDTVNSTLVAIENPIRDDSCVLTMEVGPLAADYPARLEQAKHDNAWFCADFDCAHIAITMYDIVRHNVAVFRVDAKSSVQCETQICYLEKHAALEFYKKLFVLLYWGK